MAEERKENDDKSDKDQMSEEEMEQTNKMGVEEKDGGRVADEEQQRKELEILQEKEKLKDEMEKYDQRLAELTQNKENIDRMAMEAKETADDLMKSYEQQEEIQNNIIQDQSVRSAIKEELTVQIKTIRDTQGDDSPELEIIEAKLMKLEEEGKKDEARENEIRQKKDGLEKLLLDHAVSMSEIESRRKSIDEEIVKISAQRKIRELEEQKLLARINELRRDAQPTALEQSNGRKEQVEKEVPREGAFPLNNASLISRLREEEVKAVTAATAMRAVKNELSEILKKGHLTEEDIKGLPLKQNEVLFRLAELDEITRRVQDLMGLTGTASSELSQPSKLKSLPDLGRPRIRTLSQLRPEEILPQVVICGTDLHYPQIVVCDSPKFRDAQERIVHNRTSNAGSPQWSYPGPRSDVFGSVRPADGHRMEIYSPYYGTRMGPAGPFGQNNMPIASWMISPGFGYTIRPQQAGQESMVMSQRMFHPGMLQSASVGSVVPCPCICPKKRRKRKTVPQQVYSCPNINKQKLHYSRI